MGALKDFFSDGHRLETLTRFWVEEAKYVDDQTWTPELLYTDHNFEAAIELIVRGDRAA
jgi:hypothetical protein